MFNGEYTASSQPTPWLQGRFVGGRHRSSVAGCAQVRYDCLVFSHVVKIGTSDVNEHDSPQIAVQRALRQNMSRCLRTH